MTAYTRNRFRIRAVKGIGVGRVLRRGADTVSPGPTHADKAAVQLLAARGAHRHEVAEPTREALLDALESRMP